MAIYGDFEQMINLTNELEFAKKLAKEAGGKVTDLNGNERRYDENGLGCIVSNGILHNEIVEIVQSGKL
jgi:hypothetical protein